MIKPIYLGIALLLFISAASLTPSPSAEKPSFKSDPSIHLPYEELGWSDELAAEYLLNRLAFGPKPGEIKEVVEKGLNHWVLEQLNGIEETAFEARLERKFPALKMSLKEINHTYPAPAIRLIVAGIRNHTTKYRDGKLIDSLQVNERLGQAVRDVLNVAREDPKDYPGYEVYERLTRKYNFKDFNSLMYQLMAQKLVRAIESKNQLKEVLVDFWFNHFNVSITRVNDVAPHTLSYEKEAIRPYVLGKFEDLLQATARHPAMLIYLDNNRSNAEEGVTTLLPFKPNRFSKKINEGELKVFAQTPGINENYARELLELHTMGVDGGYTQKDVEEVSRIFTGWKASPFMFPYAKALLSVASWSLKRKKHYVLEDGFYFDPQRHDAEIKIVLGKKYYTKGGVEEGNKVLTQLASHPSTAHYISSKLAQFFLKENPPQTLVNEMAEAFQNSDGDIKKVMIAMLESKAFWQAPLEQQKIKSPFEFIVSSARTLNVKLEDPIELLRWCTRMGQPLYAYQAPTGYPDENAFWTNGTGLLKRMDFALQLAQNEIPGVAYFLSGVIDNEEQLGKIVPYLEYSEFKDFLPAEESLEQKIGILLGAPFFQLQ